MIPLSFSRKKKDEYASKEGLCVSTLFFFQVIYNEENRETLNSFIERLFADIITEIPQRGFSMYYHFILNNFQFSSASSQLF